MQEWLFQLVCFFRMRTFSVSLSSLFIIICIHLQSCKADSSMANENNLDIQGHRGCRGLMPENTIAGFKKALDFGVNTLELDVGVSKDKKVIVSHEPFFNHEIATAPDGSLIDKKDELTHNMYELTVEELQKYDVGLRPHPRFPIQKKIPARKPTLAAMVETCESYAKLKNYPSPLYNIEIKRSPIGDNSYHPPMAEFADLVINTIDSLGIMERTTVQCFDIETLQYLHKTYTHTNLVYLIHNDDSFKDNIEKLGFNPSIYSPYFKLVDESLVKACQNKAIKLVPWTVNESEDVQRMIALGVDGIISDFPDMVIEINNANAKAIK